jgi:hypothetical protein
MSQDAARITMPGIPDDLRSDIEQRVHEFEQQHQHDLLRDGPGWVPRIRAIDYAIAIVVNAVFVVWLVIALAGG